MCSEKDIETIQLFWTGETGWRLPAQLPWLQGNDLTCEKLAAAPSGGRDTQLKGRGVVGSVCEVSKGTKWWKGMIVRLSDCNDCKGCEKTG